MCAGPAVHGSRCRTTESPRTTYPLQLLLYPRSTRMRFNASSDHVALLVNLVVQIAPASLLSITINQYASNLVIGLKPNRLNSLSMIALTVSALSGVVMIES